MTHAPTDDALEDTAPKQDGYGLIYDSPRFRGFLSSLLVLALVLRIQAVLTRELWFDEFCSVWVATSNRGVLEELRADTNAPLYFLLLKGWIALFGVGEVAVRFLSVLLGILFLGSLPHLARALRLPAAAALGAVLAGALIPAQVHYAAEARGYTLACLLISLSLATFAAALSQGRMKMWILHGICLLAALYTHNLVLLFLAPIWTVALLIRPDRRTCLSGLLTHGICGLLYLPWLIRVVSQTQVAGLDFIGRLFNHQHPYLMILRSLEVLGPAPWFPGHLDLPSSEPGVRYVGLIWVGVVMLAALIPVWKWGAERESKPVWGSGLVLGILVLVPLTGLLIYSLIRSPLYLVGRYDILASPAWLLLLGLGMERLRWLLRDVSGSGGRLLQWIPVTMVVLVSAVALTPILSRKADLEERPETVRGLYLQQNARPGDVLLCYGWEPVKISYLKQRYQIPGRLLSYPESTLKHPGWFNAPEVFELEGVEQLSQEAQKLATSLSVEGTRIWLFADDRVRWEMEPAEIEDQYLRLAQLLIGALKQAGYHPAETSIEQKAALQRLGIHLLVE